MIENDPIALRRIYFDAWQKSLKKLPVSPIESMIIDILIRHPEYQPIFSTQENFDTYSNEKFKLDHNPFFHIALHVTILEQVGADRPRGISILYQKLLKKFGDQTLTEHKMMECLARILVDNFAHEDTAHETLYLEAIQRLL